jgi:hypothetical protein
MTACPFFAGVRPFASGGRIALAWMAAFAIWLPAFARAAEDATALEQRVKAAFLYQFAGYVEWPPAAFAQPDTPVTIATFGADSVAAALAQVAAGRSVGGRTIVVRRLRAGESLAGIHILFFGKAETARLDEIARAAPHPILTVTESEGALAHGSMVNFVIDDRRVRFEIALDTVENNGLKMSSRLLSVARDVRMGGR